MNADEMHAKAKEMAEQVYQEPLYDKRARLYRKVCALSGAVILAAIAIMALSYVTYGLLVMIAGATVFTYTDGYLDAYREMRGNVEIWQRAK